MKFLKAGNVKLLASMGNKRLPYFPDIPTLKELGYNLSVSYDIGIGGPKGIPSSAIQKLQDALVKASEEPKFQDFVKKNMMVYNYMGSEQYSQYLKQKYDFYAQIIKELGLAYKK
jgi:tripartite-type tricarboxylate transporter receptor subunit TctC